MICYTFVSACFLIKLFTIKHTSEEKYKIQLQHYHLSVYETNQGLHTVRTQHK